MAKATLKSLRPLRPDRSGIRRTPWQSPLARLAATRWILSGETQKPVTGSLNAGLAQWMMGTGLAPARYVESQGHTLGRDGRVVLEREGQQVWVGDDVTPLVVGTAEL